MPGDPLRAKFISENFLENAKLVNNVRGIQGYTGFYKNTRVSVMASGMGMPSIGIYSYELFNFFEVDNIIRIGSAGGMCDRVKVRDIVIAQGACTTSRYSHTFNLPGDFAPISDFTVLRTTVEKAEELGKLPRKADFVDVDCIRIKAALGPWPRALEAAGLKTPKTEAEK